jgi:hypothetical protein
VPVEGGRVEEGDAVPPGGVDNRIDDVLIDSLVHAPEGRCSQSQLRDGQATTPEVYLGFVS